MRDLLATDFGWTLRQREVLDLVARGQEQADLHWRWLPSGRVEPPPFDQGAKADVWPDRGVVWRYPAGPYVAPDGTQLTPDEFGLLVGTFEGVHYYRSAGGCTPGLITGAGCFRGITEATGDESSYEWHGPDALFTVGVVAPGLLLGTLAPPEQPVLTVLVDVNQDAVHPVTLLKVDGRRLVPVGVIRDP